MLPRQPCIALLAALLLALSGAGCGDYLMRTVMGPPPPAASEAPGKVVGRTRFERPEVAYDVGELPETWQLSLKPTGDFEFVAPSLGAVIATRSTCNRYSDASLSRLARDLFLGVTEPKILREETVPFSEREALDVELEGKLDGVPVKMWVRVLKKNRCIFDFTLVAPPARFEKARGDYAEFLTGFGTLEK